MKSPRPIRTVWGPSRTSGETIVCVTGSALVMALLVAYIADEGGWHDRTVLQTLVLGAVIFDLSFGMFTISTATARAWYHRAGADARRFRFGFVTGHLCYFVAGAALFDTGWKWAIANAAMLVAFAIAVDATPGQLKRLVALGLALTAALVNLMFMPLPAALAWLPALLFVKVLVCFLVPDAPAIRSYSVFAPPPSRVIGAGAPGGGGFNDGGAT
jgi:hypothetical protein